jgi:hypothetical protein
MTIAFRELPNFSSGGLWQEAIESNGCPRHRRPGQETSRNHLQHTETPRVPQNFTNFFLKESTG